MIASLLLACTPPDEATLPPGGSTPTSTASTPTSPTPTGTSTTTLPTTPPGTETRDGWPVMPWIDDLAADVLADAHVPGASAALVHGGALVWASPYGVADEETGRAVAIDSPFMLASVSKTVTATALMQARDEGLFALDDDVNGYLSYTVGNPRDPQPVTFRQLLMHTSGIVDDWSVLEANYVVGDSTVPLQGFLEDYLSPDGAWYHPWHYAPWEPGTRYSYSNVGAALLGGMVEVTTGQPFDRWCDDRIFAPLGMTHTGWHLADIDVDLAARPHLWSGTDWIVLDHFGYPDYPDGELRSTAEDMGRFLAAYASGGGPILQSSTVDEMWTVQDPVVAPDQGLIWYWIDWAGTRLVGHNGGDVGVASDLYVDVDGNGFVLLMNAEPRDWDAVNALEYAFHDAAERWPEPTGG